MSEQTPETAPPAEVNYWNFVTERSESRPEDWEPTSDEEARCYIPQSRRAQTEYDVRRRAGATPVAALVAVLMTETGGHVDDEEAAR